MPFTGFWDRWRRRQLQQQGRGSTPSLREAEKQREAAEQINLSPRYGVEGHEVPVADPQGPSFRIISDAEELAIIAQQARTPLEKIYFERTGPVCMKWRHYLGLYDRYLSVYREKPIRLLQQLPRGVALDAHLPAVHGEHGVGDDLKRLAVARRHAKPALERAVGTMRRGRRH